MYLLEALAKRLEGDVAVHKSNIQVYLEAPAGIGEHPQIIEALESEVAKLAESHEKLDTVLELLGE